MPATVGNPLFHWTHLELRRIFGISELLRPESAEKIYDTASALLARDDYRVRALLTRMNVRVVCTTDDPTDTLEHHAALRADPGFPCTVTPTFRPDQAMDFEHPADFNAWIGKLEACAGREVSCWEDLIAALQVRHDFFHQSGCRASDHGIEMPYAQECTGESARRIFSTVRGGTVPSPEDCRALRSAVMLELARMDARAGWVQMLHMGALRNVNTRFLKEKGPNTGFDTIGIFRSRAHWEGSSIRWTPRATCRGPSSFALNPSDTTVLTAMAGRFPEESVRGKMQVGPAWWFNDQQHGIEEQLRVLADIGLLPRFIGMLTDSRSFLSFPRTSTPDHPVQHPGHLDGARRASRRLHADGGHRRGHLLEECAGILPPAAEIQSSSIAVGAP